MRMMKVKYKVVPNFVIRVQYLFIFNSLPVLFSDKISKALTLSRWGPELRIHGGGRQKRLGYILWPYVLNESLELYEI